ncbi:MAG: amino acid ABC transporter permease [Rhizobiales bacterium]|nr:amino acid ABC transporter permease [Hyphomicrobiales bacterium]NRB13772.1 amino acid ABC transporter permease [Hyphomicrobiales bacterium]
MSEQTREYPVGESPELPAPNHQPGAVKWVMENLFSSIPNGIVTILGLAFLYMVIPPFIQWAFIDSVVLGAESRQECNAINPDGACWAFIYRRWDQFVYGFYPADERWRVNISFILVAIIVAIALVERLRAIKGIIWVALALVVACIILIVGFFGLERVPTNKFGGFMLTLIIGLTGIFASLPIGIVLALSRLSTLPIFSIFATIFIEFIRGVPLITLLFIASTLLSYFLPPGTNFDLLVRVLIMVTLFSAAYLAEVIRGGLAAIPRGQYEAADALGLSYWKSMRLVILPQALKISIPGIVSSFIGLFKDTTLVLIIGLLDPLGIGQAAIADVKWIALSNELYVFIAIFFFIFCFSMSRYSLYLERKLHTGH